MIPQEAIFFIKECGLNIENPTHDIVEDCIVSALEKQILKKPRAHTVDVDKLKIGNANWCKGTTVYRCPNCNDFISRIYDFCYKCGQALDWGVTE